MSSINDGVDFIYGGISSNEIGVKIASGFGSTTRSGNVETRDIITSSAPSGTVFGFHGVKYTSPNTFDLIIYNEDGSFINEYQERQYKKILMSSTFKWLSIDQDSLSGIFYYCIGTKFEMLNAGTYSGGALISFQMDSISAWSNQNTKIYTTSGGSLNFKMNIDTDYDDEIIKPILIITPTSNGNISIENVTRDETIAITSCVLGEEIILDGFSGKINTTSDSLLIDRWNKRYLKLQDSINNLVLTGNFTLEIKYRQQIRIGG